jgi:hypothetical protein
MAATGEPYTVAARALAAAEQAAQPPAPEPAPDPAAAASVDPTTTEPTPAGPATVESGAEPTTQAGSVIDPGHAADSADALAGVIACAGRTLAAPSARLQIQTDTDLGRDADERIPRQRRRGPLGRLAGRAARAVWERAAPDTEPAEVWQQFLHQFGAGFIEPAAGRYLVDFGGYAEALVDGRRFGGLSGAPLGPRYEQRPHRFRRADPLDVLRTLQRATAARLAGTEQVRWTTCQVVTATADDSEFTVWLDGQRVQRFRTVDRGSGRSALATRTETIDLWDFGVPVDDLDWSRLPTFRTAARQAGDA